MNQNDIERVLKAELTAINRTLAAHGVDAGCLLQDALVGGRSVLLYKIRRGRGVRIADVARLLPELAEAIGDLRRTRTPVRLQTAPVALEVPHPRPAALPLTDEKLFSAQGGTMLAGRSYGYQGAQDEVVELEQHPHALICGITGAGKSVLLRNLLLTLAAGTGPDRLRLVLVDLKNEDLRPLAKLPHVLTFAGDPDAAAAAVATVHAEKDRRRDTGDRPFRLVLAIDELAEMAQLSDVMQSLSSLLALGRSLQINVIAATQHPTAKMLGGLARVNFSVRLCGLVTDANAAAVAAGRPGTGAELLPGRGAFLRIAGADVTRFQSFYTDAESYGWGVRKVAGIWRSIDPALVEVDSPDPTPEALAPMGRYTTELAQVFEQYAEGDGLRRGGMAKALRALYGKDAPKSGRAYQEASGHVMTCLHAWLEATSRDTPGEASQDTSRPLLPSGRPPQKGVSEKTEVKLWM